MGLQINYRKNCFNLIRIIAAIQVMYGHIITHLEIEMPKVVSWIMGG